MSVKDALHVCECPVCKERGNMLQLIDDVPVTMVNDSESLRHSIKTIKYIIGKGDGSP